MPVLVLAATLAATGSVALTDRPVIVLDGRSVRVADVVDGIARSGAARVEIARVPVARREITLSRRALASLIRRAAPQLSIDPPGAGAIVIRVDARHAARPILCWRTNAGIAAGAAIDRARVVRGACAAAAAAVRFDRERGAIVATTPLPAGSVIGPFLPPPAPAVARGDTLTVLTRAGVVTIERSVTALQPGRSGRRVFVRDGAGHVFAATVEGESR